MYTSEDFRVESVRDFIEFIPVVFFLGLIAPFIIGAYTLGFMMNVAGWLD